MGCNQSVPGSDDDSDSDSTSNELPFEKVPFNNAITTIPSRSSLTTSKTSCNLNNINTKLVNLHKINVTPNGTASPISNNDITPFPTTSSLPPLKDEASTNSAATPNMDKKVSVDITLTPPVSNQSQISYRTKKVTIYKPNLRNLPKTTKKEKAPANINKLTTRRKHTRETSKDDLDITLQLSMKRKSYRNKMNAMDPRLASAKTANRLSVSKRDSVLGSYQMQYDLGSVTDIEDESEDDEDNVTVVRHDSSLNYESDDSFWDAQYKNSSASHRRKATYHAYGGDDDAANKTDSESGIGAEYDEEDLSDDSLNEMARIATGFNEDHRMTNDAEQDDIDDDETDIETAHRDHLHQSTATTINSNEDIKHAVITKQISTTSDETCSLNEGSSSSSIMSAVDKSSISMHQIDKAAFLQKILRNSINKHRVLKDEEMKKQKELALQETHKTSNIVVIDDNTIAINIGISKMRNDPPIPEGNEEENQSEDSEDTDTDEETAQLDFRVAANESEETSDESAENMQHVKMFKVISDEVSVFQDIALKDEIFSVQLKKGERVHAEYTNDAAVILLNKTKLFVASTCVMEVKEGDVDRIDDVTADPNINIIKEEQDMDQFMAQEKEEMNKLKEMLKKINSSNIENDSNESNESSSKETPPSSSSSSSTDTSPQSETSMESKSSPSEIVMEPISKNMTPPPIVIDFDETTEEKEKGIKKRKKRKKKKALSEKVSIQKGKRKKKKKKKKQIISATPPSDTISPQFFYREKHEKVRPITEIKPDRPRTLKRSEIPRPESPIIAKYGEQLVENKEEILKMIEEHKRNKKKKKIKNRATRAQTDGILKKYNAKENKKTVNKKRNKRRKRNNKSDGAAPKINAVTSWDDDEIMSFKDRMKMYEEHTSSMSAAAQKKVKEIKAARKRTDSEASMSEEQKQRASHLLQQYATSKAKHIADVTLIAQTLRGVTAENSVEKLELLGVISYIFVEVNEFARWNNRNNLANMIDVGDENRDAYDENATKYKRMAVMTLLNSKILIKLAEDQKSAFKKLILFGLEQCKFIYKINFNAANITNAFLEQILRVIAVRNEMIAAQQKDEMTIYGPELLLIENNPISDRGIAMICGHIAKNDGAHLKCLKVGHCFATISSNLCEKFCQSLQQNEFILKVTFDMRWLQHRTSVDKSLKQNYSRYRALQKKDKKRRN